MLIKIFRLLSAARCLWGINMISDILKDISDLNEDQLKMLFYCLNLGFEDEWDCDLSNAFKNFGNGSEWAIAAKYGINYAKYLEDNR